MSSATPYDYADSLQRMGNDERLFQEMVGFLRADSPRWLRTMHAALRDADYAVVERAAHCLKGLASNFSATRAVESAAIVERLAGQLQVADLPKAIADLEDAFTELVGALESRSASANDPGLANLVNSVVGGPPPVAAGASVPP